MNLIGFDFGTTNTLIAQIIHDEAVPLLDEQGLPTPSLVCYEGVNPIFGLEAKKRVEKTGLGVHGNIIRSPKSILGKRNIYIGGQELSTIEIVRSSIEYSFEQAKQNARSRNLNKIDGAVVTIPINMDGFRRKELREAFNRAGIQVYQFIHEPFAALYGYFRGIKNENILSYEGKIVLVVDWGGGTLDVTLCTMLDNKIYQISNYGSDKFGGDVIDELIKSYVFEKFCKEKNIKHNHEKNIDSDARLLEQCERAKIDLSSRESVSIFVGSYFSGLDDNDFNIILTRNELNSIIQTLLDKSFSEIDNLISKEGYRDEQISLCLATGGMSNMPKIRQWLIMKFSARRTKILENSGTLVAEGAAWVAQDKARLILAKNLELQLARNSYFTLCRSGTEMPIQDNIYKNQINVYCCDPRDGKAKIIFCTPNFPGDITPGSQRHIFDNGCCFIKVDRHAKPFFEAIHITYWIDENLIFTMKAESEHEEDIQKLSIYNLEFGIELPKKINGKKKNPSGSESILKEGKEEKFLLKIKSNIVNETRKDDIYYIPGDYLYYLCKEKWKSQMYLFDARNDDLSSVQRYEYMYSYSRCIICGKKAHQCSCRWSNTQ